MGTTTFTPVLGKKLRVIALDKCGNVPASGTANSVVVTDGFINVKLTSEMENGADIITKKANGALCVNKKVADSFKRFAVEIEACGVDPGLLSLISGLQAYQDYAGNTAGILMPEGQVTTAFSLELWSGLSGSQCPPGAVEQSGYFLLPWVIGGVLGDMEFSGDKAVSFTIKGAYTQGGTPWGVGPYSVKENATGQAAKLPTPLVPADHMLAIPTNIPSPPSVAGLQPFLPV